jgi:hypothetical protein
VKKINNGKIFNKFNKKGNKKGVIQRRLKRQKEKIKWIAAKKKKKKKRNNNLKMIIPKVFQGKGKEGRQ